jgi:iron complex outermembrane recepter protein
MKDIKRKKLANALVQALGAGVALSVVVTGAMAQQAQKVEKIEVTGSNIKRVDTETAAPVQIITREEIERTGKTTITELLRQLPQNLTGGLNDLTGSNSFSSGASTISLRGLGSTATLVLLNGRRIAPYGLADPNFGQSAVVNLDALPLDVVDRIEILKDGASAIYGSEAVAGVVNIILRKDYKGAQVGGYYSMNRDSEYKSWRANGTIGFGDLARDRYNVFFNAEHYERERVGLGQVEEYVVYPELRNSGYATGRHFSSSFAGSYLNAVFNPVTLGTAIATSFKPASQQPANCNPGAIKDAGGICRFDLVPQTDLIPKSDRDSFYTRGSWEFANGMTLFGEGSYNKTKTSYTGNPQVYGDFGIWYSATQNRLVGLPEVLPVGNPSNPFTTPVLYRHRFVEVGNTDRLVDGEATRGLVGVRGTFRNWDWESALLYSENKTEVTNLNQIRASVLTAAVLNGTYNFLNPGAGSVTPAMLRVDSTDRAKSSFTIWDLKGSGELFQMAAGPLGVAAGVEYRKEEREANPDPLKQQGEIVGFGAASAQGDRNVWSIYGELSVPILRTLEMQLAARTDRYSDYGNSTTPKVGLKWKVLPTLAIRGNYAEAFRAPSLTENSKSSVSAFTAVTDPQRCLQGTEADCARTVAALIEANPSIQPEKAKTYTAGIVWEPMQDLSLAVDFFDIRRRHEINTLDIDLILANEGSNNPLYANRVIRGPSAGDGLPGQIQAISIPFFNNGETQVKGADVDFIYVASMGDMGRLRNRFNGTYLSSWKGNGEDGAPLTEFIGYRVPRVKAVASTEWQYRAWTTGLTVNYIRTYHVSSDPRVTCRQASLLGAAGVCEVPSRTWADLAVQWTGIKNLTLSAVIQNLFDKKAPLDPLSRPVNFTYHSPLYRSVYATVGATYKFW